MAPNSTLPNSIFLAESPLDLTMSPNSDWKKNSNYHQMRITSRRVPISQRNLNDKVKSHDGISSLSKVTKSELGLKNYEQQNGKVQPGQNNIDSLYEKRKHIARKWLKENLLQTNQAVSAIYALLAAYSSFCLENGEQPVSELAFLNILKTEFSGQSSLNDSSVSHQDRNNCIKANVPATLLAQKRKHAAYVEGEMFEKRQRNFVLEQQQSMNRVAVSKYLKLKTGSALLGNGTDSVELTIKRENTDGRSSNLEVEIFQQHGVQFKSLGENTHHSSLKEAKTIEDVCDSDSNDSGCEEIQTMIGAYRGSTLPRQNKAPFESDSLPFLKSELHAQTFLEFGSESCDSGTFDTDSDKHSDSDNESQQLPFSNEDRKGQPDSSEASSSKDEDELGSLVIDETVCENSPTRQLDDKEIPKPVKIKEELLSDEDTVDKGNQKVALISDLNQKTSEETRRKVISNVITLLNLKEFSDSKCFLDASKFSEVFLQMMNNNLLGLFLQVFGHSMSCKARQCSKLCFMFKRIMKHLTSASSHKCAVKHIYGHILRLHIDTCKDTDCGISNCELLQRKRLDKGSNQLKSRD